MQDKISQIYKQILHHFVSKPDDIINEVINTKFREISIKLVSNIAENENVLIKGYELGNIISDLIENGIRACDILDKYSGHILMSEEGQKICIDISDNGCGILKSEMKKVFEQKDIELIARTLGVEPKFKGNNYRFEVTNTDNDIKLSVEIYPDIQIGAREGNLISIYAPCSHLQLHFCTGYVVSEMLGEVTFIGESDGKLSGLIVEKEAGCSMYTNVDRDILSGDFTTLGPEIMLSGVALSLAEDLLPAQ